MILRALRPVGFCLVILWTVLTGSVADVESADYEIEVALDPVDPRLEGFERIRWTNTADIATSELYFHLYLNAFANSETTFMREAAESPLEWFVGRSGDRGWTRITNLELNDGVDLLTALEFVRPDDANPQDHTVARVALPREIRPAR